MHFKNRYLKNKDYLSLLSHCKPCLRKAVIEKASKEQIYSICECILNISNGNIKLNPEQYKRLKPFNKSFKKILDKKTNLKQKKKLILQKGGFLQFLIPSIISGIATIISSAISNKKEDKEE